VRRDNTRIDIGDFAATPDWRQDAALTVYLALASCRHAENVTLVFPKLNDLIDKYAPNLKKIMNQYPEVKKALTMPDGKIYSFPTLQDPNFLSGIIGSQMWINKNFLDKLGMKVPETTEELYNYLVAVKTKDPNGNGKADEVPFAAVGIFTIYDQLKGAWGLGNRGNMHPRVDVDPATNKLRFIPADPRYKEVLEYLNAFTRKGCSTKTCSPSPATTSTPSIRKASSERRSGSIRTRPLPAYPAMSA
jgi:putative aldouronate transport system substrate-binding protein